MMSHAMLSLLVAVCAFQVIAADPLSQLRFQAERAKNNVNSLVRDLERSKWNIEFSTTNKINNKKFELMENVNSIVNPAVNDIRADVDAAKAQGKNAEKCADIAKDTLRTASLKAFADINECQKVAVSTMQSALSPIDVSIAAGKGLLNELDSVFLGCMSGNIMQMQTCIAIKLGTINVSVRLFENNVNSVKLNAQSNANNAVPNIQNCGFNVISTVRGKATDARIAAGNCIKNA